MLRAALRSSKSRIRSTRQGPAQSGAFPAREEPTTSPRPSVGADESSEMQAAKDPAFSTEWSEKYRHLSHDGKYYPSYQDMARANGAFHIKNFSEGMSSLVVPEPSPPRRRRREPSPPLAPEERRVSPRIQNKKPEYAGLGVVEEEEEYERPARKKRKTTTTTTTTMSSSSSPKAKKTSWYTPPLAPKELQQVQKLFRNKSSSEWRNEMEDYLLYVKKVSPGNCRSVMGQVDKLASRRGVTYHHWKAGVVFRKGKPVTMGDDFHKILANAKAFEAKHGADRGNGWLLTHPIKKLANFQYHKYQSLKKKNKKRAAK